MNIDIHYHIGFLDKILVTQIMNQLKQCLKYQWIQQILKEILQKIPVRKLFLFVGKYLHIIFILSGIKFENERFLNVLRTSLNLCNEGNVINPISYWYLVIVPLCIVFMYTNTYTYPYINIFIVAFIVFIMWIYNLVIKWTEQNCVRGFCHRIETLFSYQ